MPIRKSRYNYVKFQRPNGMRYATYSTPMTAAIAVDGARIMFYQEFGYVPRNEDTIIDIMGTTGQWTATFMEIKD